MPTWVSGFTLVETLVAISILLIAVAGPISLIGDSLHKIYYAKDEALAVNLAQEGVELVRQVRDSNMLNIASSGSWLAGLNDGTYVADTGSFVSSIGLGSYAGNGGGRVSPIQSCTGSCASPQPVYYDATTGLYRQGTVSTKTQFTRTVTISSTGLPANERKVTSTVNWQTGGSAGTVSASEYIFSWAL